MQPTLSPVSPNCSILSFVSRPSLLRACVTRDFFCFALALIVYGLSRNTVIVSGASHSFKFKNQEELIYESFSSDTIKNTL